MPSFGSRILEEVESRTGIAVRRADEVSRLEEAQFEGRNLRRELDLLAYSTLDYFGGRTQDLTPEARRSLAQKSRVVWMRDPMAGAAVDLMNDFVFGKGVPKPKAKDALVQEVIDEFWDDPDNQRILTSHSAMLALGTDLTLQSNLFVLIFDDGEDGRVKLSLLEHDAVKNVVKHPDDRFCVLWYLAERRREEWDFDHDAPKPMTRPSIREPGALYYEHWQNYEAKVEEASKALDVEAPPAPPARKKGKGKVFHLAENRTTEMVFGHPRMDRTLRWYSAYNAFMEARVDMMKAAAAMVMKRKVKGTPNQIVKAATRALSRRSDLAIDLPDGVVAGPQKGGSILTENEAVTHEPFSLNSNAGNAAQDAAQLRSQISAATRWSQAYYGDASQGGLTSNTTLELPILKAVETRSEMFEQLVRWAIDRAIERAVDAGRITNQLTPEEIAQRQRDEGDPDVDTEDPFGPEVAGGAAAGGLALTQAHEDKGDDEDSTERDLGYEFSMPNPLRRALGDIIGATMNVAKTFDPNNTNVELSRALLTMCLEEMEFQDAAELVERIFPPGYEDPAVAAAAAQAPPGGPDGTEDPNGFGEFGPVGSVGADGQRHANPANPYGAPMNPSTPEQAAAMQQSAFWPRGRDGEPLPRELVEAMWARPQNQQAATRARVQSADALFEATVGAATDRALRAILPSDGARLLAAATNGNGNGRH